MEPYAGLIESTPNEMIYAKVWYNDTTGWVTETLTVQKSNLLQILRGKKALKGNSNHQEIGKLDESRILTPMTIEEFDNMAIKCTS